VNVAGHDGLPVRRISLELEDYLLLAAVLLLPWAFGGVEIWAFRSAALLLVSAASVCLIKRGVAGLGLDRNARWLLPAFLLALWAAFQIIPLPPTVIGMLSPRADEIYRQSLPAYAGEASVSDLAAMQQLALSKTAEFEGYPGPKRTDLSMTLEIGGRWSGWRTISLLPCAGQERLFWYVALFAGFLVARRRCFDPDIARLYRNALFALFLALATFGLIYAATSNGKLYWVRGTMGIARPFGPYVNPTNFAAVMELAIPWLIGFTLLNLQRMRGMPLSSLRSPLAASTVLLCLMAAVASASKGSALLLLASLVMLGLLMARRLKTKLAVAGGALLMVLVMVPLLSHTPLGARVRQFMEMTGGSYVEIGRLTSWKAATGMVADFPVTGSGFGSFRDVFPGYMPSGESARWAQLHNDYYEFLVEGGIIAGLLLLWLIWNFWSRVLRRRCLKLGEQMDLEAIGLLIGLGALSIHALFDFNHQIPANGLLFVILAAMAAARSESPAWRAEGQL
jgi:O-antigen ligase